LTAFPPSRQDRGERRGQVEWPILYWGLNTLVFIAGVAFLGFAAMLAIKVYAFTS
jgi:hypothetical protein